MPTKFLPRTLIILLIVLANVGLDQISKNIARERLEYHETIEVAGDFFILTKVENTGAFLSLGSNLSDTWRKVLLTLFPCIVVIIALLMVIRNTDSSLLFVIGFCFIIGGGIGNLWDRILYESVTDFMNMGLFGIRTGIFNVADLSITSGMVMVIIDQVMLAKQQAAEKKAIDQAKATDSGDVPASGEE